jgi:hypothetical protein
MACNDCAKYRVKKVNQSRRTKQRRWLHIGLDEKKTGEIT